MEASSAPAAAGQPRHPETLAEPAGWAAVVRGGDTAMADLFSAVAADVDALTDRTVTRIRAEVQEYAGVRGGRGDLWWSSQRNIQTALVYLAERRPLTEKDLAARRALGVRSAERGIPLEAVMHAFRLGYIVVWDALHEAADSLGPAAAAGLLDSAGPMWLSLDQFASALASGHRDTSAVQAQDDRRRALAFVDALRQLPAAADQAGAAASALGLDPAGSFLWAMFDGSGSSSAEAVPFVVDTPTGVLGLVAGQSLGSAAEQRLATVLVRGGARHVGVGLARPGVLGARQSLLDAEQAHAVARGARRESCLFRTDWLDCLVVQAADQLSELLAVPQHELTTHPELNETLQAFLAENGNLAATGKRLHLHPNTVAYRLARFADRTEIDVRTSSGIAQALVLLALAPP